MHHISVQKASAVPDILAAIRSIVYFIVPALGHSKPVSLNLLPLIAYSIELLEIPTPLESYLFQ